ncbi:VOC family protein [uncultured Jatrophihabitans sp.]|uniref:VOC family protein n=1 Tax=uncultured Jatrophihabitans sp. TaxID=1610747 RepID=UPI0035CC7590
MPEPTGDELTAVRERRRQLRSSYLRPLGERPAPTTRGIHHAAFVCRDVEETIRFYQEFLGFPLVELVENRDYAGSSHFFFDLGNHTLLGFFDFPGLEQEPYKETIGALQHLALSVSAEQFDTALAKLDASGIDYVGPDRGADDSLYIRDPNGMGIELYREELGRFDGLELL